VSCREQLVRQNTDGAVACFSDVSISDLECVAAATNASISGLLSEAYRAIGDPDGIYGCSTDRLANTAARSVRTVQYWLVT